ncbi:two-component response regulator ARR12 [Punica granatum]|uniref:Two-component response regulator n=1 Tax=Punica granatum TaxID=22663 RepID=A0A218VZ84_PUNGR|nr:two-component response regulator ARR12 [Punica granatum]OWM65805.1 hypothetical protein CDL15_Pgr015230 [Punica granatum]
MTVESRKGGLLGGEEGSRDMFPVGMRVLAVDDDPTCLKILDNLLRYCKYHVTTTNQAVMALKMLREKRDEFDLVISDVNMPDMDGFKLLELVGLEMDIPVIMLSAHSDYELVKKGVTHGAVDYLNKPVRVEELKNIWQHVVRRKKIEPKDQNKSSSGDRAHSGTGEVGQGASVGTNSDLNGKVNRKRSDHDEEEDDEGEENGRENEDSSSQKKPRVVWSVDLHRKFVAAVNQLGLEKAVPKKILDLMNVEGLTRENVASHLQKYRLYLKRIHNAASQQANLVAALGSKDPSYMRYGSPDGYGDFRGLTGPGRLSATSLSSYPPGGMLGRLNTPAGLGFRGISSTGLLQPTHSHNSGGSAHFMGHLQSQGAINPSSTLFQGIPSTLEVNQLQPQSKVVGAVRELNVVDPMALRVSNKITDPLMAASSSSNNSLSIVSSNHLLLQNNRIKPSVQVGPLHSQPVDLGPSSSGFIDQSRCNDSWHGGTAQNSKFSSINNHMPLSEPLNNFQLPPNGNFSSTTSHVRDSQIDFSSPSAVSGVLDDSRRGVPCQGGLISNNNSTVQNVSSYGQGFGAMNSLIPASGFVGQKVHHQETAFCSRSSDAPLIGQSNSAVVPANIPQSKGEISSLDSNTRSSENYLSDQTKTHDDFFQSPFEPLDELMNAMIKREHNDGSLLDGDLGFDPYPLGSCI